MSIYVRRSRLPEPGKILFCTAETILEDLELLLRRFFQANSHDRAEHVCTIADVHNLSYTRQCSLVEKLRIITSEYGTDNASILLILSGHPRQVLLNALSSQTVDLPPLAEVELQQACAAAFR